MVVICQLLIEESLHRFQETVDCGSVNGISLLSFGESLKATFPDSRIYAIIL